jgi:hypothetical protein
MQNRSTHNPHHIFESGDQEVLDASSWKEYKYLLISYQEQDMRTMEDIYDMMFRNKEKYYNSSSIFLGRF